jgi:N utilization substance protein A
VDPAKFVCNALAPAQISRVIIDEENRSMEVIVPDEHLSIAIGKRGQNVRLASKLTKWHLDVISEERYSQAMQAGYNSLLDLPGVGQATADALYEKGFYSAAILAEATAEDLLQHLRDIDVDDAQQLIAVAQEWVAQHPAPTAEELAQETAPESGEAVAGDQVVESAAAPDPHSDAAAEPAEDA